MVGIRGRPESGRREEIRNLALLLCLGLCLLYWLFHFLGCSDLHWTVLSSMGPAHHAASTLVLLPARWTQLQILTATSSLRISSATGMAMASCSGSFLHFLAIPWVLSFSFPIICAISFSYQVLSVWNS